MEIIKSGSKGGAVKNLQTLLGIKPCDGIFGAVTDKAVREFQRKNGLMADGIVGRKTWEILLGEQKTAYKKSKRTIKEIIVHCAATPEGKSFTVDDIRTWHKNNGWSDIGYHYVIYTNGAIHLGRDVDLIGAHCNKGGHNTYSIGVCYVGGVEGMRNEKGQIVAKLDKNGHTIGKDTRTPQQKESLIYLLKELKKMYPNAKIYGHHDFDKGKGCPCFDAKNEYKNI